MTDRDVLINAIHKPAYLLWLLRKHSIGSFDQLSAFFDDDEGVVYLNKTLDHLKEGGIIDWDAKWRKGTGRIEIKKSCSNILSSIGASLTELANRTDRTIYVEPLFTRPNYSQDGADVFVLMPFTPELKAVYDDHLKKVCNNCKLSVARADDFFNTHDVMTDVWAAIYRSRIVIAECSGRNPNVFYELGIAHTIGKPVVLITQSEDDVPFDIRHRRYIKYDFTPRGMAQFETSLTATLIETLNYVKEAEDSRLEGGRYG